MKKIESLIGIAALAALAFGTACHKPTPVDKHWGEAYHANVSRQVANPCAGKLPAGPIEGLDPITGEAVIEVYKEDHGGQGSDDRQVFLIEQ